MSRDTRDIVRVRGLGTSVLSVSDDVRGWSLVVARRLRCGVVEW
jgi:hypothetical protein